VGSSLQSAVPAENDCFQFNFEGLYRVLFLFKVRISPEGWERSVIPLFGLEYFSDPREKAVSAGDWGGVHI